MSLINLWVWAVAFAIVLVSSGCDRKSQMLFDHSIATVNAIAAGDMDLARIEAKMVQLSACGSELEPVIGEKTCGTRQRC